MGEVDRAAVSDAPTPESSKAPFELTESDKWVLSHTDEEFKGHSWEDLKEIIAKNDLAVLKRKPSDLRRYISWSQSTAAAYGSVTNFVVQERLHWTPPFTPADNIPLSNPSDYKILINDWPYGMPSNIKHLIVWSKTPFETDDDIGDLTPPARKLVDDFVRKTFTDRLDGDVADRVLWFKNWVALQSVRSLQHVHVLVRDPPEALLQEWLAGAKVMAT